MIRKLVPLFAVLVLSGGLAACGDDDKSDSGANSSETTAVTSTPAEDTTSTAEETTSSDDGTDVSENPQVQEAVQRCKDSIDSNPQVKDDVKDDLKAICDKAASGDAEDLKSAIKEVCVKIVESSVPEGSARDQAKQACESAG